MSDVPDRCNQYVFKNGHAICALDARMWAAESWVQKVAELSGAQVDWHYSGGIANVLYIGDYERVLRAIRALEPELNGRILRVFEPEAHGLYRAGDELPAGVIAVGGL